MEPAYDSQYLDQETLPAAEESVAVAEGSKKANVVTALLYVSIPPVVGFSLASWLLVEVSRVPWVLMGSVFVGAVAFIATTPLGRRSEHFEVAAYRRAAEVSVLVGLTAMAVAAWTVGPYLVLGIRQSWVRDALALVFGG